MTFKKRSLLSASLMISAAALTMTLAACNGTSYPATHYYKNETAKRLAAPSFMHDRRIASGPFSLTVYERVREKGGTANIYIEGNGTGRALNERLNKDMSPSNPVGLHLAAFDHAPNVIYMARPCQYSGLTDGRDCDDKSNMNAPGLYSETAIKAMNDALNDIKNRYALKGFNLIGYDGGAAVAVILSAGRDDVMTLRTVGGQLDPETIVAANAEKQEKTMHKPYGTAPSEKVRTPENGMDPEGPEAKDIANDAMNPMDYAPLIASLPQHHFIGEHDAMISSDIYMNYYHATSPRRCLRFSLVENADHKQGIVNAWPEIMNLPVDCTREESPGTIIINKVSKED